MVFEDADTIRTMRIAFMSGAIPEQRRFGLPDIQDVFSNGVEVWTGYPLTRSSIDHHPTPYLIERCKLMGILREVHSIILVKGEQRYGTINDFANTVESLAARMHHWYAHIPAELQYEWPMSSAVWELQYVYLRIVSIRAHANSFSAPLITLL